MASERIKLRPFSRDVQASGGRQWQSFSGGVVGRQFVISAFGQIVALTTVDTGTDRDGPFALVTEQTHALAGRIRLVVAREYEEDADPGGQISAELPQFQEHQWRRAVEDAGVPADPDRVILLMPLHKGFWVYFDSDGRVNGSGSLGAAPQDGD